MHSAQTHLPSESRMCRVSDARRHASHLKVLLIAFQSNSSSGHAGHLTARVVLELQVLPPDELQDRRDVLALVARLGVTAEDEVGAGARERARFGVAEEVVAALDARLGLRDPPVGLRLEDLHALGARRALLRRAEVLNLLRPLFGRRFHAEHYSTKRAQMKHRFAHETTGLYATCCYVRLWFQPAEQASA